MNATAEIETDEAKAGGAFPEGCVYLSKDAPAPTARQVALVPGAYAPLMTVALPRGLRGHAREQVAERQLRDALADGRDTLEIRPFHTPDGARDWTRALVADRTRLDAWRDRAGVACKAVLPDYLALPADADVWTVADAGGMVLARLGPQDGFAAAPAVAERLLGQALAGPGAAPKAAFCIGAPGPELEALFAAFDVPVAKDDDALRKLGLTPPRALAHGELAFDLRRDPRAARARLRRAVLPWRWPVLAGLAAAGLWAGTQMLATRGLENQTAQYRAATLETVRAHFVPAGPVLDVRAQVGRALAEARVAAAGAGDAVAALDLLGLTADVMTRQAARPDYVDYTQADGLSAAVRVENFAAADDLATALRAAGLAVTVLESRVSDGDDGVRAILRIAAPDQAEAGE